MKTTRKEKKVKTHTNVYQRGVYYWKCYNEGHYTKDCKFCTTCKGYDHNIDQFLKKMTRGQILQRNIPMNVV